MSLIEYRASANEQLRTQNLLALTPSSGARALDVGARDGHFSRLLAERFDNVVALDLTMPDVRHPKVTCVKGNAAALEFADGSFDFVLCAEVLEHLPASILPKVCSEMQRVCRGQLLIGVPYRQDLRLGQTTCQSCGKRNPPWGHVNSFDEYRLKSLFDGCSVTSIHHVGNSALRTNALAAMLMDMAGNPYGTYTQDEACIHCDSPCGGVVLIPFSCAGMVILIELTVEEAEGDQGLCGLPRDAGRGEGRHCGHRAAAH